MRRWKILAVAVLVLLGAIFAIVHLLVPAGNEPAYHGKGLSAWLKQLDDGKVNGISSQTLPSPTAAQTEAAGAIQAMGAEALPILLRDIHAHPSPDAFRFRATRAVDWFVAKFRVPLQVSFGFEDATEDDRVRWRAAQGLAALGPAAKTAVPELKRLLFTNYFHSSIKESAYALATIGPEGFEILTNAALSGNEWPAMCAIWSLGQHPEVGTNAVPCLVAASSSASVGTACGAIQVLGLFHSDAEQAIPALTNALARTNSDVGGDAVRALAEFGPQAAAAVPLLERLTNDPITGNDAQQALNKIRGSTRP